MSENESDVQRERATDDRDNVVLTGEEIELPGDGSDAAAIIGETSKPINTGEIESVAIGGLTGRVPGAAPLKPAIEDKISTGELPVVPAPAVEFADEADSDLAFEDQLEDASFDAPEVDGFAEQEAALADDFTVDDEDTEPSRVDVPTAKAPVFAEPVAEEPVHSPIMTPAQAAAALGLNLDSVREDHAPVTRENHNLAEEAVIEDNNTGDPTYTVGGAAAEATEASSPSLSSRRSMIFGDDEPFSPSIPALSPAAQEARAAAEFTADAAEEHSSIDVPTTKLPKQRDEESAYTDVPTRPLSTRLSERRAASPYSFEDQDQTDTTTEANLDGAAIAGAAAVAGAVAGAGAAAARDEGPRRRSLLNAQDDERDAATLASIASAGRERSEQSAAARLDEELFGPMPTATEMPSRTGAYALSFLLFLFLAPLGWYLAADAGARMTLAEDAPMFSGIASLSALGELLGTIVLSMILCVIARRSSLLFLLIGMPWVLAPGITAAVLQAPLTALSSASPFGENLMHHLQATGYSGRFVLLGVLLMGVGYISHSARRDGRSEEALRTSIEAVNPAGALYSKRARKKAAKDLTRK